jgi:hypothetical protein
MRRRIAVSAAIGLGSSVFCWFLLRHLHLGAGDFNWAIWGAQDLLAHRNPYDRPMQLYPLPCAILGIPFAWMRPEIAGGAFYGISSALLALGLSRHGHHRLLLFLAYPYWAGIMAAQWTPLILASTFFPFLLPATLAKPQLGLPVALTTPTRWGLVACGILLALTLVIMPGWPRLWIGHFHLYERFIPLFVVPGPLLALALLRWRERDARLLLLMAAVPQRWFYDMFILWFIPKSRREILATVFISWGAGIWRWYHFPHSFAQVGRWCVLFFYLPMLAVVLARQYADAPPLAGRRRCEGFPPEQAITKRSLSDGNLLIDPPQ